MFKFLCIQILEGKSVIRSFLNYRLKAESLRGKVIDIGGGENSDYLSLINKEKMTSYENVDPKNGQVINFEEERLPYENNSFHTSILFNVLEHVFNYNHLLGETIRVTKSGGKIVGFVPFLMWYHPDHKDYFRYTHDALNKIFLNLTEVNYTVETIERGPLTVVASMVILFVPKFLRNFIFIPCYSLDYLYLKIKKTKEPKYVLGYYFVITKK